MSFFDFFKNQPSNADGNTGAGNSEEPVIIFVTPGNEVTVPASEAATTNLDTLFRRYADVLGIDAEQVGRYTDAGRCVSGDFKPEPGRVYQGSANSFTKG